MWLLCSNIEFDIWRNFFKNLVTSLIKSEEVDEILMTPSLPTFFLRLETIIYDSEVNV